MIIFIGIYYLSGLIVSYYLSKSYSYGVGSTVENRNGDSRPTTTKDRIYYTLSVALFWPLALINYRLHFRQLDIEKEYENLD